jgi:hypothetical protein
MEDKALITRTRRETKRKSNFLPHPLSLKRIRPIRKKSLIIYYLFLLNIIIAELCRAVARQRQGIQQL